MVAYLRMFLKIVNKTQRFKYNLLFLGSMEQTSSFLNVMGDYPLTRLFDFLLTFDEFDYSLTEIAENAGVGYSTLQLLWPQVEGKELIICTRKVGKSNMFMINKKNPVVQELIKLQWEIAKSEMGKELQKKEIKVGS